jgi:hypothetical protein
MRTSNLAQDMRPSRKGDTAWSIFEAYCRKTVTEKDDKERMV